MKLNALYLCIVTIIILFITACTSDTQTAQQNRPTPTTIVENTPRPTNTVTPFPIETLPPFHTATIDLYATPNATHTAWAATVDHMLTTPQSSPFPTVIPTLITFASNTSNSTSTPEPTATRPTYPTRPSDHTGYLLSSRRFIEAGASTTSTSSSTSGTVACDCSFDRYNCSDTQAIACFSQCNAIGAGDVHRLDRDNDGRPCEQT